MRKKIGIVLFDDVEVLDFCGPFEVFSVTRLDEERRREEPSPFEVMLVAQTLGPITTTGGMRVLPHRTFEDCPRLDIVVMPGGWGTRKQLQNPVMLDWMRDSFPAVNVEYGKHFVEDGRVFTSAGIAAGIDMSLKVVARCFGETVARATARQMEYAYPEDDARRIEI